MRLVLAALLSMLLGTAGAKSWPKAVALRKELEQAASE